MPADADCVRFSVSRLLSKLGSISGSARFVNICTLHVQGQGM